jgi:hypothetical protein
LVLQGRYDIPQRVVGAKVRHVSDSAQPGGFVFG